MNERKYIQELEQGIAASKIAAFQLLTILARPLAEDDRNELKEAVQIKKMAISDYFHILGIIKRKTDTIILFLQDEANRYQNKQEKIKNAEELFYYLEEAYLNGIDAIELALGELLKALEQEIDPDREMTATKLKAVFPAKKIATDDYFSLVELKIKKQEEVSNIHIVVKPVEELPDEVEVAIEVEEEKLTGYAESYAVD